MSPPAALFPQLEQLDETATPSPKGIVLLVEDDESLADLLMHLMARMQVSIVHASTGAMAVQLFAAHRQTISLAFVDCHLPDGEGGDLCRKLRAVSPALPLLLTSGRDQRALEGVFTPGGPCSFLAKPYMPAEVMGRIRSMLVGCS